MKIKTRRKGFMDVRELNAYQVAYGKPLSRKDYFNYVGIPCLFMGIFSYSLCYYWWVALICSFVGGIYGFKVKMPKSVKREYNLKSLAERNKFINNITQILSDESKTTIKAIGIAKARTKGELRNDIQLLEAKLQGADKFQISEAFNEITRKYEKDVVFTQYLEQIETAIYEGYNNADTLKQIKSYHNDILTETNNFMKIKEGYLKDMKQMIFIIGVFIISITFSFGFATYYNAFAHTFIGWIFGGIYYTLMIMFLRKFFLYYFDDEIMSLGGIK
ncbi:TPA: hypothetical protein PL519_003479 [Clostridium botulinum]|nr:hypothetical protein [Clostridium botulinum]